MHIHVKIKPGSKVNSVATDAEGSINIKIKAPAKDGKANDELIRFLSKKLDMPKSSIRILSGFSAPFKKLEIDADEDLVKQKLLA